MKEPLEEIIKRFLDAFLINKTLKRQDHLIEHYGAKYSIVAYWVHDVLRIDVKERR